MLIANSGTGSRYYRGDGSGSFGTDSSADTYLGADTYTLTGDDTRAIAVGDVDGDGYKDVVFGNSASENKVLYNPGKTDTGAWRGFSSQDTPTVVGAFSIEDTRAVLLADVNIDGFLDVIAGNAGARPEVTFTSAAIPLGPLSESSQGSSLTLVASRDKTFALAIADLDSDLHLDIISGDKLYLNKATPYGDLEDMPYTTLGPAGVNLDPSVAIVGDLDNDGDNDVILGFAADPLASPSSPAQIGRAHV